MFEPMNLRPLSLKFEHLTQNQCRTLFGPNSLCSNDIWGMNGGEGVKFVAHSTSRVQLDARVVILMSPEAMYFPNQNVQVHSY